MNKLFYCSIAVMLLSASCSHDEEPIREEPPVENPSDKEEEKPEDKTEVQHVLITANVSDKYKLPVGTRCEAEFYDEAGKKLDCKKTLASASERSFHIGADLDKGKQYTCLLWFDNGSYSYDISEGLKKVKMSTKPTYAFYGKLIFNSDTQNHTAEMKPAVAQAVLKLNNVTQTGSGIFSISETTPIKYVFNVDAGTVVSVADAYTPKKVFLINNVGKAADFCVFAPDGGMKVNLQIDYNGKAENIENVTLQRERTTTLEGDLETMDFNIIITDFLDTNEQIEK